MMLIKFKNKIMKLKELKLEELSYTESKEINGGLIPFVVAWGIIKIVAAVSAVAYGGAYAIGNARGHYDNN
jgi:hypothetical protein